MAKEYAKKFYHFSAWISMSKAYAASQFYICEVCGKPAKQYCGTSQEAFDAG